MESFQQFAEAAAKVDTKKYSWGTMKTVHHGASFSIPLHPEHHQAIHKLKDGESHSFTDETKSKWKATREGDKVHFHGQGAGNRGYKTTVSHEHMKESADDVPFDPPYHKAAGTTTDKSGAKHTPMSKVRHLARMALKKAADKKAVKEEAELNEKRDKNAEMHDALERHTKHQADAKTRGDDAAVKVHQHYIDNIKKKMASPLAQESTDACKVCGQTPCNCTAISESAPVAPAPTVHRIGVTVSDPSHTMASKRKETVQKFVRVTHHNDNKDEAIERGKKHFAKKGFKVHDAWHAGNVHEEVQIDEAKTPAEKMDFERMMAGAMSRDDYNKKYKKGKYAVKSGKYRVDPTGIYHNLIKSVKEQTQIDELSNATLQSYKDKAMKSADDLAAKGQHSKANDRYMKHMQASGKQIARTMSNITKRLKKEEVELDEAGAYQKDMDEKKPVVAQGVKGMKSKPFTKKFKTMKHFNDWSDSEKSGDHEVHRVYQEETDITEAKRFGVPEHSNEHVQKKIKNGEWEATHDIKQGRHLEIIDHSKGGKRKTIYVK